MLGRIVENQVGVSELKKALQTLDDSKVYDENVQKAFRQMKKPPTWFSREEQEKMDEL